MIHLVLAGVFVFVLDGSTAQQLQVPCPEVPCNRNGGRIERRYDCGVFFRGDRSTCPQYDKCVCNDGFKGSACEHECGKTICPDTYQPVCGSYFSAIPDRTFENNCKFLKEVCNNSNDKWVFFNYDGACQNDSICGPARLRCPQDVAVYYTDDPTRPGCKLCQHKERSPCYDQKTGASITYYPQI